MTLDDLPRLRPLARADSSEGASRRLLHALSSRGVPATVFVTCGHGDLALLDPWVRSGIQVGNHTWSHRSLDEMAEHDDPSPWVADVMRCEDALVARWGVPPRARPFRFPYLRTGATRQRRDRAAAALGLRGFAVAPVSIDTSDWVLARAYAASLDDESPRGKARRAAIVAALVEHIDDAVTRFVDLARRRHGRPVKHILLLHGSALTADALGAILDGLRRHHRARFISLDEAMSDPVYALADDAALPFGPSWLLRTAPAEPESWAYDVGAANALGERFAVAGHGLRRDRAVRIAPELMALRLTDRATVVTHEDPWAANSLVYETRDGTLVLAGSPYTPEATADLLWWLEARYGPRRLVHVATHFHFDASGGTAAVQGAGGTTIASERTAELLATRQTALREATVAALTGRQDSAARIAAVRVPPPDRTFPDGEALELDFGEVVEIRDPGPGHSDDNVVVWFPGDRVLFGGCLVRAQPGLGNTADADLSHWPSAIRALRPLGAKFIVPGHGERFDPGLIDFTLEQLAKPPPR